MVPSTINTNQPPSAPKDHPMAAQDFSSKLHPPPPSPPDHTQYYDSDSYSSIFSIITIVSIILISMIAIVAIVVALVAVFKRIRQSTNSANNRCKYSRGRADAMMISIDEDRDGATTISDEEDDDENDEQTHLNSEELYSNDELNSDSRIVYDSVDTLDTTPIGSPNYNNSFNISCKSHILQAVDDTFADADAAGSCLLEGETTLRTFQHSGSLIHIVVINRNVLSLGMYIVKG